MLTCPNARLLVAAAALALPSTPGAASDPEGRCHWSTYGLYNLTTPAFTLALQKPQAEPQQLTAGPVEARRRQVLVRQIVHLEPDLELSAAHARLPG